VQESWGTAETGDGHGEEKECECGQEVRSGEVGEKGVGKESGKDLDGKYQ